jgi:hypothetical protein
LDGGLRIGALEPFFLSEVLVTVDPTIAASAMINDQLASEFHATDLRPSDIPDQAQTRFEMLASI